jgi:hypothetical protein
MKHGAPLASASEVQAEVAAKLRISPSEFDLAWLLHRSPNTIVIPVDNPNMRLARPKQFFGPGKRIDASEENEWTTLCSFPICR